MLREDIRRICHRPCVYNDEGKCNMWDELSVPYETEKCDNQQLTGSCKMGREAFMSNNGLSLDDKTSIREFVELTKDSYGGEIIKKLPIVYGME